MMKLHKESIIKQGQCNIKQLVKDVGELNLGVTQVKSTDIDVEEWIEILKSHSKSRMDIENSAQYQSSCSYIQAQ